MQFTAAAALAALDQTARADDTRCEVQVTAHKLKALGYLWGGGITTCLVSLQLWSHSSRKRSLQNDEAPRDM